MSTRFSSDAIKRQGAIKTTVRYGDKFINTFTNGTGNDSAVEAGNLVFGIQSTVRSDETNNINGEQFQVAKSFFNRKGQSASAATTMALLALDAAKLQGISVMKFLEPLATRDDLLFDFVTYVQMNLLRSESAKQGLLVVNNNKSSPKNRTVLP